MAGPPLPKPSPPDPAADRVFLDARTPLRPDDAVAAIIEPKPGHYLMQQRDAKERIFFPGHWGLFGGGMEAGEDEMDTLARELQEELGLDLAHAEVRYFTRFDIDYSFSGHPRLRRSFYSVKIPELMLPGLVLGEGQRMKVLTGREALTEPRVAPYDRYALWLYESAPRLAATGRTG